MHWVYILECEDGYFYVGETSRLFRRCWEHDKGSGGLNTSTFTPIGIVAIYSVERLGKFFDYVTKVNNNDFRFNYNVYFNQGDIIGDFNRYSGEYNKLFVENQITEKMMISNEKTWEKIRGGKYTRFDCKFFIKFDDNVYRTEHEKRKQNIRSLTSKSYWLREISDYQAEDCIGGCGKKYDENNTVRHMRRSINLCFECFIDKNEELAKKYKPIRDDQPASFSDGL